MALVPFSYASPFTDQLKLRERLFTIDGRLLRIQQAWKGDGKGGTEIGFGASVYPAAYVLAEYLERHPDLVRGKRVIELGTGTGFLGIAAAVLGAAEVCLTDGDEESLRLTEKNVRTNLASDRTVDAELCGSRQTPGTAGGDDATGDGPEGSVSGRGKAHDGASGADAGSRRHGADRAAKISVQKLRWGCADDMQAAGCPREDGGGASCGRWDVVLGSDIAALPYASAYDELLRTILSLVNSKDKTESSKVSDSGIGTSASRDKGGDTNEDTRKAAAGATSLVDIDNAAAGSGGDHGGHSLGSSPISTPTAAARVTAAAAAAAAAVTSAAADRGGGEISQAVVKRQVVVLLAHKRRHASEDTFFEDLRQGLGDEQSVREIGEEEIHSDFRGSGIHFHMFAVDVGCVGPAEGT